MRTKVLAGVYGAFLLGLLILTSHPIAHSKPVVHTVCVGSAKDRNSDLHFNCADQAADATPGPGYEVAFHKCYPMPDETSCVAYIIPKGYGPIYFEGFHW